MLTPREQLTPTLDALASGVASAVGARLVGVYLVGSFALGCGDEHSDVDFMVVLDGEPDRAADVALAQLHRRLPDSGTFLADHLEGSYAPASDLRSPMSLGRRWRYVDNGSREIERSDHDNTAHTRWLLRERGLVVTGPPPRDLVSEVSADQLRAEALGLARARAEQLEEDPSAYDNGWFQPYCVLTCARILYTAAHAEVTGKVAAATWALDRVDPRYADLLRAAVADRPDPWERVHRSADPARAALTRSFVWDTVRLAGETALEQR